jgi:hypothetical protein
MDLFLFIAILFYLIRQIYLVEISYIHSLRLKVCVAYPCRFKPINCDHMFNSFLSICDENVNVCIMCSFSLKKSS